MRKLFAALAVSCLLLAAFPALAVVGDGFITAADDALDWDVAVGSANTPIDCSPDAAAPCGADIRPTIGVALYDSTAKQTIVKSIYVTALRGPPG